MAVIARDTFTDYGTPASSGSAPVPDVEDVYADPLFFSFVVPPTAGDQLDYVLIFSTGIVVFSLVCQSTTQFQVFRTNTIPGVNTGTVLFFTVNAGANFPLNGEVGHFRIKVTQGAVNGLTTVTLSWSLRSMTEQVAANSFSVSGEIAPTSASYDFLGSTTIMPDAGDLQGRVPDGGGVGALAVGKWAFAAHLTTPVSAIIVTGNGAEPTTAGGTPKYVLDGLATGNDYWVSVTGQFLGGLGGAGSQGFGVFVRATTGDRIGYTLNLRRTTSTTAVLALDKYPTAGGGSTRMADATPQAVDDQLYTVTLKVDGTTLTGSLDGVVAFILNDESATPITSGTPGLTADNFAAGGSDVQVTDFTVEVADGSEPPAPLIPCAIPEGTALYASECFDGADTPNIDGRVPDGCGLGCLQQGVWSKAEAGKVQNLAIIDEVGRFTQPPAVGLTWVHYLAKDIPGLGNDYSVNVTFQMHEYITDEEGTWISCLVRHDPDLELGYEGYVQFYADRTAFLLYMILPPSGVYVQLLGVERPGASALDVDHRLRFCARGNQFCLYFNDVLVFYYVDQDNTWPTGFPGICVKDSTAAQDGLSVVRWSVTSSVTGAPACGTPGSPGDPGGEVEAALWAMKKGAWREAEAPSADASQVQTSARGLARVARAGWVMAKGLWRLMLQGEVDPSTPGVPPDEMQPFDAGCTENVIAPPPAAVSSMPFALAQVAPADFFRFSPFTATMEPPGNPWPGGIPAFLDALEAEDWYWWLVMPRNKLTSTGAAEGPYNHTNAMNNLALLQPYVAMLIASGRVLLFRPVDEWNCVSCWSGQNPTITQMDEVYTEASNMFGGAIPTAGRVSPANMLSNNGRKPAGCDVAMAQTHVFPRDGFPDAASYASGQVALVPTLGLSGVCLGLNLMAGGWTPWSDAQIEEYGITFAETPGVSGLYVWAGTPATSRLLDPSTNAALQAINAAWVAAFP